MNGDYDVVHRQWMGGGTYAEQLRQTQRQQENAQMEHMQEQQRVQMQQQEYMASLYSVRHNNMPSYGGMNTDMRLIVDQNMVVGEMERRQIQSRPSSEILADAKTWWNKVLTAKSDVVGFYLKYLYDCLSQVGGGSARQYTSEAILHSAQAMCPALTKERTLVIVSTLSEILGGEIKSLIPIIFDAWLSFSDNERRDLGIYFINFSGGLGRSAYVPVNVKKMYTTKLVQLCLETNFDEITRTSLWATCSVVEYSVGGAQFVNSMISEIMSADHDNFNMRGNLVCTLLSFCQACTAKCLPSEAVMSCLDVACSVQNTLAYTIVRSVPESVQMKTVQSRINVAMALVLYSRPDVFDIEFSSSRYPNFSDKTAAGISSAILCRMTEEDLELVRRGVLGYSRCPSAQLNHKGKEKSRKEASNLLPDKRIDEGLTQALAAKNNLFAGARDAYENSRREISSSFSYVCGLPDELIVLIFSFLTKPRDVLVCGMVCNDWRRLSKDGQIWLRLFQSRKFSGKKSSVESSNLYSGHRWMEIYKRKQNLNRRPYEYGVQHGVPMLRLSMYVCDYEECNKAYNNLNTLHTHLRKHARHPYYCKVSTCKERLHDTEVDMMKHLAKHLDEHLRKFNVKVGAYVPMERKKIQSGYCRHGEKRPEGSITCHMEDCQFWTLGGTEAMKKHQRRIHSERKIVCEICKKMNINKQFLHQSDLKHHIQRSHMEKKLTCETCGKAFAVRLDLRRHQLSHESKMKSTGDKKRGQSGKAAEDGPSKKKKSTE